MEINYEQTETVTVYSVFMLTRKFGNKGESYSDKVELRKVVVDDECMARIELNEILNLYHALYHINDPWKYERKIYGNRIIYRKIREKGSDDQWEDDDYEFWYDESTLVL